MLKTLGSNVTIAVNGSETFTYAPESFQKLMVRCEDADWDDLKVTVQVGSKTICNNINMLGLAGLSGLQCGFGVDAGNTNGFATIDFGNHIMMDNSNLYVTLSASGEATATDVSVLVDNTLAEVQPLKITNYSDSVFTSERNLVGLAYGADADLKNLTDTCEIKTQINSTTPEFQSGVSWYLGETPGAATNYYSLLNKNGVPLKTTYNYTSSTVTNIITVEACSNQSGSVQRQRSLASRTISMAKANFSG